MSEMLGLVWTVFKGVAAVAGVMGVILGVAMAVFGATRPAGGTVGAGYFVGAALMLPLGLGIVAAFSGSRF